MELSVESYHPEFVPVSSMLIAHKNPVMRPLVCNRQWTSNGAVQLRRGNERTAEAHAEQPNATPIRWMEARYTFQTLGK